VEGAAARALASLPGRTVPATSQDGKQLLCDPFELDGLMLRAYLPRLQMGGVEQLTLRFAVGDQPWTARFELTEAEYHSFEQAIGVLALVEISEDGAGRQAARVELHIPAVMTAIFCQCAVEGNEYDVRVDDLSETGVQVTIELQMAAGDEFALAFTLEERRITIQARAVKADMGAYGRAVVGARITRVSDRDLLAIRRAAATTG
jgi:PilZ domain